MKGERPRRDPTSPCSTCGVVHPKCRGHARTGRPCGIPPVKGGDVCWMHGGSAPQVEAAAARRLALIAVRAHLATIEPDLVDASDAMLRQLGLAAAWERFLRGEVAGLAELDDQGIGGSRKAAVEVELWNDERDRLAKLAKLALDAGIAERQVQIAERQGALIADLIRRVLDDPDLALSAAQRSIAGQVAARHLRALGEAS